MRLRQIRLQGQRRLITGQRLIRLAQRRQRQAQMHLRERMAGIAGHRLSQNLGCHIGPPRAESDKTQTVQAVAMARINRQDLVIQVLGIRQPPGIVQASRLGE